MKSISATLAFISLCRAVPLWDTTGPYHVGYTQHIFNHTTPNDITKPGTFILVTTYYPTRQIPNTTVPYLDSISASIFENTLNLTRGSLSQLTTNLQFQAPTLIGTSPAFCNGTSPYPTLIFTPGAGLPSSSYTAYLSELASYGHAIFAIDHPGEAPYLPLPYTNSTGGIYGYPDFTQFPSTLEGALAVLNYRISDIQTAISDPFIPSLIRQYGAPFSLSKIGVFGHSIGGAASAAVMSLETSKTKTFQRGANLDGTMFQFVGSDGELNASAPNPDLRRPFLEVGSSMHFDADPAADPTLPIFNDVQTGWLRDVQVNRTRHLSLSDIALWIDILGQRGNTNGTWDGMTDGRRVTELVGTILRKFFGGRLSGVDEWIAEASELYLMLEKGGKGRKRVF